MKLLLSLLLVVPLSACTSSPVTPVNPVRASADTPVDWNVRGTWTDACCCKVACPCLFGTSPTEGYCEGASLIHIESGRHGDVSLDGLSAVVTYRVKDWTEVVVGSAASADQVAAFEALLPHLLPYVTKGAPPVFRTGALRIEVGDGTLLFASDATEVELELVESASGEPIRLENLPAKGTPFPISHGHTQYRSRRLAHSSDRGSYEWSERNGFRSRFDLSNPN